MSANAPQVHFPIRGGGSMKWPPEDLPEWPPDFAFQWPPSLDFWWFYDEGFPVWPDREWSLDEYPWPSRGPATGRQWPPRGDSIEYPWPPRVPDLGYQWPPDPWT